MSHVTDVKLKVHDLDALAEACEHLGLELVRGQKNFAWWGHFVGDSKPPAWADPKNYGQCEHAIKIKGDSPCNGSAGPWEIGVVRDPAGDGYRLLFDYYGRAGQRLVSKVGNREGDKLKQEYAVAVARRKVAKTLARDGWKAVREELPDGKIRLKVRKL